MSVRHLQQYANQANGVAHGNTKGSPQSQQVRSGDQFKRPAETSPTRQVPEVSAVNSFESKSVKPGNSTAQPPKDGGRMGSKGMQEHIGDKSGNKRGIPGTEMN